MSRLLWCILLIGILLVLPKPAAAQSPAPTPTTTPAPNLTLPDWVQDPDTQVLALFAYENLDYAAFPTLINVKTDERFVIDWSHVDQVGWVQAAEGTYLKLIRYWSAGRDNSTGFVEYVSLSTGNLTRLPFGDTHAPVPAPITSYVLDSGTGRAVHASVKTDLVPIDRTGLFSVQSRLELTLVETDSDDQIPLHTWSIGDSEQQIEHFTVQWLAQGTYLGVWTQQRKSNTVVNTLDVYDAAGTSLWSRDNAYHVRWFDAEQPLVLFEQPDEDGSSICWGDVATHHFDCNSLRQWRRRYRTEILNYGWSHDGQAVLFNYRQLDESGGGLCIFRRKMGSIYCPVERTVKNGTFVSSYIDAPSSMYGVYAYANQLENFWDTQTPRESDLCFMNRETFDIACLSDTSNTSDETIPPDTYYNRAVWSPSGQMLAFTYTGQQGAGLDGLCLFDMQTADLTCPVRTGDLLIAFQQAYIENVAWSPDGRYVAILYTAYGPLSDDKSYARYGVVDAENGTFRDLGYAFYEHRLNELWRP